MAWETRNGRGSYYTRSVRVNGRVKREYIGTGPTAQLVAELDEETRRERERKQAGMKSRREELEAIDGALNRSWRASWSLVRAVLVGNGYHRHHRGEWRKRNG